MRVQDMWGFANSQETVNVSPEMYEEFIFPYEKPVLERFGLNSCGCCEPLNTRWHVVKRDHNLRRVSCSPWADLDQMAGSSLDAESIRHDLRESLEKTKGCVVEIIMKDNHTIGGRPENLVEWCHIAREEAERIARR